MSSRLLLAFVAILCLLRAVQASYGDTSVLYQRLVNECLAAGCPPMPLSLRLTQWSCLDDCRYRIMHQLTDAALAGETLYDLRTWEVTQFHGKWPFYRLLGMQEPASVFFSFFNFAVHAYWFLHMEERLPKDLPKPLRWRMKLLPLVGLNAWTWSAVFHTRDKMWTERADYFSAAFGLLVSDYYALVRVAGLYRNDQTSVLARRAFGMMLLTIFTAHVSYLSLWRFNYGYNMKFNIGVGVAHNLLWYIWAAFTKSPLALRGVAVMTGTMALGGLEVFDFAPLFRIIDAHALWHLTTAPALIYLYDFWLRDADYVAATEGTEKPRKA